MAGQVLAVLLKGTTGLAISSRNTVQLPLGVSGGPKSGVATTNDSVDV